MAGKDVKQEKFTEEERLEWIKTYEQINKMDQGSGLRDKMYRKIKENPLVPVGILATTIALTLGLHAMKSGNKKKSQMMMRARIGAQGFTIFAILGGILYAAKMKPDPKT